MILDYLSGPNVIMWTFKSRRGVSQKDAMEEEAGEIRSKTETHSNKNGFKDGGRKLWVKERAGLRELGLASAQSQQGNRDLSCTAAGNWILPTARMSKEIDPPQSVQKEHSPANIVILAPWDPCWTSNVKNSEIINLHFVNN